jgi:hypothetical protein
VWPGLIWLSYIGTSGGVLVNTIMNLRVPLNVEDFFFE